MKFSEYRKMVQQFDPSLHAELDQYRPIVHPNNKTKEPVFTPVDWLNSVKDELFIRGGENLNSELALITREHLLELDHSRTHGFVVDS